MPCVARRTATAAVTPDPARLGEPVGERSMPGTRSAPVDGDEHRSRGPGIFGGYLMPEKPGSAKPTRALEPCAAQRHGVPKATHHGPGWHVADVGHPTFFSALSAHGGSADLLTGSEAENPKGRKAVGVGEVPDATVSLCAYCSGAFAVVEVSLTAADVRVRSGSTAMLPPKMPPPVMLRPELPARVNEQPVFRRPCPSPHLPS